MTAPNTLHAEFYRLQDQRSGGVYEGYVLYGMIPTFGMLGQFYRW